MRASQVEADLVTSHDAIVRAIECARRTYDMVAGRNSAGHKLLSQGYHPTKSDPPRSSLRSERRDDGHYLRIEPQRRWQRTDPPVDGSKGAKGGVIDAEDSKSPAGRFIVSNPTSDAVQLLACGNSNSRRADVYRRDPSAC